MTKKDPTIPRKYTTYLQPIQIRWLRRHALDETERRGYEVTAAQILRELIDQARK